ncbi:MAG: tripartite tricarboxylate transporter permease [Candidatus Nanoarchaeia archaeon]|nr:tripartite tricarboxylate transporter permease [Candidatus Nanoarchaeia archaeon]
MIEIYIAILLGCIAGTITGITPGVHLNLVSVLIISSASYLLSLTSATAIGVFIIAMSILHTFTNAIPSIFLGAPEESTALAVLPGHSLLLQGRGYEAVKLTLIGGLFGLMTVILLLPLLIIFIPLVYSSIENYIVFILIFISIYLIFRDKLKFWAFVIFTIAGILGIVTLNLPIKNPLFPLLSGLFGTSGLLLSIKDKVNIPKQEIKSDILTKKELTKSISSGVIASILVGLLPGVGSGQAAIVASSFSKEWSKRSWLILVGSIDTITMFLSIVGYYTIQKARSGSIVAVSKIMKDFTLNDLILFVGVSLIVAFFAVLITLTIAKFASTIMTKINYQITCISIILLIVILSFVLTGFIGFLILLVSTFIGLLPALKGVGRTHLMGCLILPVILYFIL